MQRPDQSPTLWSRILLRRWVMVVGILVAVAIVVVLLFYGQTTGGTGAHSLPSTCGEFGTWTQFDPQSNSTITWTGRLTCS